MLSPLRSWERMHLVIRLRLPLFIYFFVFLYSFYYIKICAIHLNPYKVQMNQPWKKSRLTFVCYSTEPTPLGRLMLHHFIDFELPKGGGFHIAKTIIIYYDCWRYCSTPITFYVSNPLVLFLIKPNVQPLLHYLAKFICQCLLAASPFLPFF